VNTKYKEESFVNIVQSHEKGKANMNSKTKRAENVVEELN